MENYLSDILTSENDSDFPHDSEIFWKIVLFNKYYNFLFNLIKYYTISLFNKYMQLWKRGQIGSKNYKTEDKRQSDMTS
jgi:hypothetical protein